MSSMTQLSLSFLAPFCVGAIKHVKKKPQKSPQKSPNLPASTREKKKEIKKTGIKDILIM